MEQHTNAAKSPQINQEITHNAMVEIALSDPKNKLTQEEKDVRYQWFVRGAEYMALHALEQLDEYKYMSEAYIEDDYEEGVMDGELNLRNYIYKKLTK